MKLRIARWNFAYSFIKLLCDCGWTRHDANIAFLEIPRYIIEAIDKLDEDRDLG